MTTNVSRNTTISSSFQYTTSFTANRLKFSILLVLQLASVPCFLWVFYQFACQKQLRKSHHHHVILLLLLVSFMFVTIALPITEAYMYLSYVYPQSQTFCSLWNWLHYSLNMVNCFLMGFASIERNWLIFHPWLVGTLRRRLVFHYCPLLLCLLYPTSFYFGAIFIHQCKMNYDYTQLLCKWPCYFYNRTWGNADLFANNYAPLMAIPLFCAILYIRVVFQKRTMKQEIFKWKRDRKMILQLWAISSLYLAMWMPMQLAGLINSYWDPRFLVQAQIDYMYLFPYLIHLIYPFVILITYHKEMLPSRWNRVQPQLTVSDKRRGASNPHS